MYVVAIDQGTTSCRAVAFDEYLNIVFSAQKEFTQYFPKPGWVEHDALEIWDVQEEVLKIVLDHVGPAKVAAIGITNQRETTILWDKESGAPLDHAIVWQDRRTSSMCEAIRTPDLEFLIRDRTGLRLDPYFSGTKIKWLLDNNADRSVQNILFGTVDTWLLWKMTGGKVHATDPTNASRTMLYDINTGQWDHDLVSILQVPLEILPEVLPNDSTFGYYYYAGLEIPILSILGDQQAALFGQLCTEIGQVKNTYGTGCFMLMNTGKNKVKSDYNLLSTIAWRMNGETTYALEGSVFIAGAAIQWLRDGLKILSNASQSEEMARHSSTDSDVVFVPAFVGLGAPYWRSDVRGAIFGLTRDTSREDIVRAALESLAFQTKDVLDSMVTDSSIDVRTLKVDGGACQNDYLMQFQADILDVLVDRPIVVESTAVGTAMMAGVNAGIWTMEDLSSIKKSNKIFSSKIPNEERDRRYSSWKNAIERVLA